MKNLLINLILLTLLLQALAVSADTLRIMTYNLLNYPGTTAVTRNPYFRSVIHSVKPDVLVAQEMQDQAGVNNFRDNVMNYYQAGLYSSVAFRDGPDTDNSLFYQSSKVTVISANYIATELRDIAEYVVKPNWSDETLRIYSVHLKASDTPEDEQKRLVECTTLRNYLNTLPSGTNFIIVGDFNTYKSSDLGLQALLANTSDNDGRAKDPLNLVGTWNSNFSFRAYHTQSPRTRSFGGGTNGGMDDRFDLILTSYSSLDDNILLSTYTAYGNDGNHYNDSINRLPNAAVPDSVANGLHYAADHLPVLCNFVFPDAGPPITTNVYVHQGWNLVSLPLNVTDATKTVVFPSATSNAFYYGGIYGYLSDIFLRRDVGYWLKFSADETVSVVGQPRDADTINVTAGWNLIGAAGFDLPVTSVIVQPDSNLASSFFGFSGGYFFSDTLRSGGAYFIKVNQNGKLILR